MSALQVQPPREAIATVDGKPAYITPSWYRFFMVELFNRIGGQVAQTIPELTAAINALTARVAILEAATGAGWKEVEVDFGSRGVYEATVIVIDATVTAFSRVVVVPSGSPATGRTVGDALWDGLVLSAQPAAGQFTVYALATPGPVAGKRKIIYQVG